MITKKKYSSPESTSYADYYFSILKNLNTPSKLDLISQLSQSLKLESSDKTSLESLFGAYKSEQTADEIIAKIRSSKTSNSNFELPTNNPSPAHILNNKNPCKHE